MTITTATLPTPKQIAALTDIPSLRDLCDDVERGVIQIETQLEFETGDEEWAKRAANALAAFRFAERALKRRLHNLVGAQERQASGELARRPDEDIDPLTHEVLKDRPDWSVPAIQTVAEADDRMVWLVDRINAVRTDREDEIAQPASDRDEAFLAATGSLLRHMNGLRSQVQNRRGELARSERQAHGRSRERMFIDAARGLLPGDTFAAIWDRVAELERQTTGAAA